jgi:pimeloyl-ACP methyl ester carboxylesterase
MDCHSVQLSDGRRLSYAEYGEQTGKPLLYFHGGFCSRLDLAFADKLCAERGIRLIAPDRPGIGQSDRKADRTLLDWADDVSQFLEILNLGKVSILGWSLGGPYVLVCANKLADRLSLVGTSGGMAPLTNQEAIAELELDIDRLVFTWPRRLRWILARALELAALMPPSFVKWDLLRELSAKSDREIVMALSDDDATEFMYESMRQGAEGNLDDYWAVGGSWGFRLEDIAVPVILWQGGDDKICPLSHARQLAELIPKAELRIVPGEGHFQLRHILPAVLDALVPSEPIEQHG